MLSLRRKREQVTSTDERGKDHVSLDTRSEEQHSFLSRLTRYHLLSHEQEISLAERIARGDKRAKDRLVEANIRLVISIAKTYRASSIPFEDLVQEGTIGLMTAVERFDPKRGYRFSTYATQWVRQAIGRAVDNKSKAIRLPAHVSESIRKLDRVRQDYHREYGEDPTLEELAFRTGISARKITALLNTTQEPLSLDMPVGEDDNTNLGAIIHDRACPDPQDALLGSEMRSTVVRLLDILDERERTIMRKRFGFDGDEAFVLQQIGEELNISRERVRQIEAQALRKLRNFARKGQLREYLAI